MGSIIIKHSLHHSVFFPSPFFLPFFKVGKGDLGGGARRDVFFFLSPSTFSTPIDYGLTYPPDCSMV